MKTTTNTVANIMGAAGNLLTIAAGIFVGKAVKDHTDNTAAGIAAGVGASAATGLVIRTVAENATKSIVEKQEKRERIQDEREAYEKEYEERVARNRERNEKLYQEYFESCRQRDEACHEKRRKEQEARDKRWKEQEQAYLDLISRR